MCCSPKSGPWRPRCSPWTDVDPSSPGASLRAAEPERYISLLYAPAAKRPALAALYAFDAEIAALRGRVREPLPGEIRLQWWRDAIAAGMPTGNPTADALIDAIRFHDLPLPAFDNYLEARVFDLYDDPMPSRNDLEGYLGETEGAVIQMAALVLEREAAQAYAALAGHAACARGIASILAALPRQAARNQCFVPRDMLAAAGFTPEAFIGNPSGRQAAVSAMTALAREHYAAFRRDAATLPQALRPAYLPLAAVPRRLQAGSEASLPLWKSHLLLLGAALGRWPGLT
jgi:15-cis-phytoene synthase